MSPSLVETAASQSTDREVGGTVDFGGGFQGVYHRGRGNAVDVAAAQQTHRVGAAIR